MFNLNENNRIVMSRQPSDMRIGVNGMCGQARSVGLAPRNGDVYVFVGKSRKVMKLLHWERGGYVMYYKRLEQGRFHPRIFLRQGIGFRSMRWDELVLLMEGISLGMARRHRFELGKNGEPLSEESGPFLEGRRTRTSPARAYARLRPRSPSSAAIT